MKTLRTLLLLLAAGAALAPLAHAALPTGSVSAPTSYLGNAVTLTVTAADADADMDYVTFSIVSGPGITSAVTLPNVNMPGPGTASQQSGVSAAQTWSPVLAGIYGIQASVHSLNGSSTFTSQFEVLAGTRTIAPMTLASGSAQIVDFPGEIVTTENDSANAVIAQNGSNLILWSGGRVDLKPGFHAEAGAFFWAAIDHNANGYSDIEENQQNFIAGVPDAWLSDQMTALGLVLGRDPIPFTSAQALAAYQGGYAPTNTAATATSSFALVLTTPTGSYGVTTSNWTISSTTP